MTLTELSVYMKEQEQLRLGKEREEGMHWILFLDSGFLFSVFLFFSPEILAS